MSFKSYFGLVVRRRLEDLVLAVAAASLSDEDSPVEIASSSSEKPLGLLLRLLLPLLLLRFFSFELNGVEKLERMKLSFLLGI